MQEFRRLHLLALSESGGHNFFQSLLVGDRLRRLLGRFNLQLLKIGLQIGCQNLQIGRSVGGEM
jgi:hypothetical protein